MLKFDQLREDFNKKTKYSTHHVGKNEHMVKPLQVIPFLRRTALIKKPF